MSKDTTVDGNLIAECFSPPYRLVPSVCLALSKEFAIFPSSHTAKSLHSVTQLRVGGCEKSGLTIWSLLSVASLKWSRVSVFKARCCTSVFFSPCAPLSPIIIGCKFHSCQQQVQLLFTSTLTHATDCNRLWLRWPLVT